MKVEKVTQFNNNINQLQKHRKLNMSGFGAESDKLTESCVNNKKANEAIRNNFLANLSFEGHKEHITLRTECKYGPVYYTSTSGSVLPPGVIGPVERRDTLSTIHHALLLESGTRAHGSSPSYVAKEVITESPSFISGSRIKENYPYEDRCHYNNDRRSVYFSDRNERMDERTPHCDYVVYAPGAYYEKRSFFEKIFD